MVKNGTSDSYRILHSLVAKYHSANANKGNLFEIDFVFLSFSVDVHFFPAAIYNPGQCQARFGGRSGWVRPCRIALELPQNFAWPIAFSFLLTIRVVFFDTLYWEDHHKSEFENILKWLDWELKFAGETESYPRETFEFDLVKGTCLFNWINLNRLLHSLLTYSPQFSVNQQPDRCCCGVCTGSNIATAFRHKDEFFTSDSIARKSPKLLEKKKWHTPRSPFVRLGPNLHEYSRGFCLPPLTPTPMIMTAHWWRLSNMTLILKTIGRK